MPSSLIPFPGTVACVCVWERLGKEKEKKKEAKKKRKRKQIFIYL